MRGFSFIAIVYKIVKYPEKCYNSIYLLKPLKHMNIDINSKIFYPSHGAGWVIAKKEIEFCGTIQAYVEFKFIDSQLTISTPLSNLDSLKIREINHKDYISEAIDMLIAEKMTDPEQSDYNNFIEVIRGFDSNGQLHDFVKMIQYCNFVKAEREITKRVIPANIVKYLKLGISYIVSEWAVAKEIEYELALKDFEELTGLAI
jgi:RNA polymerase-interacting CarD/CdnL/TRCF family regulator